MTVDLLTIAPLRDLLTHFRYFLNLRSAEGHYHPLILFRLSSNSNVNASDQSLTEKGEGDNVNVDAESCQVAPTVDAMNAHQIYAMEANCPHLGADLSHADIEECDTGVIAVCPWHRYDFNLKTGESQTGMKACTYDVFVREDPKDGVEKVYMEAPQSGCNWRVVELRPVSEAFSDPPPAKLTPVVPEVLAPTTPREPEPVVPLADPPKTLMEWAVLILKTPDPVLKVERTRHAVDLFFTGKLPSVGNKSANAPQPPDVPLREASFEKNTVDPAKVKSRKNRAVMLHALANIEQWAIDLAWDIMARFGPRHTDIPRAFFSDFAKMALDESKHFSMLTSRLKAISPSTPYGSMPVHASLWESATVTSDSFRSRLAIIHLVHEARGLDVNPATIERFKKAGDADTVSVLEVIHADEVTHVTSGHRWFTWICEQEGRNPITSFRDEVKRCWRGDVKGPFNEEARERAGLTQEYYTNLRGEMGMHDPIEGQKGDGVMAKDVEALKEGLAGLKIEYAP